MSQLQDRFGVSERRACKIMAMSRTSFTYRPKARDCSALRMRIREIAASRVHYGCPRDAARLFTSAELYFPKCHPDLERIKALRDEASAIQNDFKELYRSSGSASKHHADQLTSVLTKFNEAVASYKLALGQYAREV